MKRFSVKLFVFSFFTEHRFSIQLPQNPRQSYHSICKYESIQWWNIPLSICISIVEERGREKNVVHCVVAGNEQIIQHNSISFVDNMWALIRIESFNRTNVLTSSYAKKIYFLLHSFRPSYVHIVHAIFIICILYTNIMWWHFYFWPLSSRTKYENECPFRRITLTIEHFRRWKHNTNSYHLDWHKFIQLNPFIMFMVTLEYEKNVLNSVFAVHEKIDQI